MIAAADPQVLARAAATIGPELGLSGAASLVALRVAMREAEHLADDIYDLPAAVLFALGRTPRCFEAFRAMSVLTVMWQTKSQGFKLEASPAELEAILVRVGLRVMTYEDVRSWVGGRLLPFGG